jgi:hypothetical protein
MEPMTTQELAEHIFEVARDAKTFAYDADLIDVALNVIMQLCTAQKG